VKEVEAPAENSRLVVVLDADTLVCVQPPEAPLQFFENVFVRRGDRAMRPPGGITTGVLCDPARRFFRWLKIHLPFRHIGAYEAAE